MILILEALKLFFNPNQIAVSGKNSQMQGLIGKVRYDLLKIRIGNFYEWEEYVRGKILKSDILRFLHGSFAQVELHVSCFIDT